MSEGPAALAERVLEERVLAERVLEEQAPAGDYVQSPPGHLALDESSRGKQCGAGRFHQRHHS